MTDEGRKALVRDYRTYAKMKPFPGPYITAADQIEADGQRIAELEREVERRTYDGIHTCHDQCQRVACVLRRRIAELEGLLREAEVKLTDVQGAYAAKQFSANLLARITAALGDKHD